MRVLTAIAALLMFGASPATAATTIYAASVAGTTGNVASSANAVGAADGAFATITRVPGGSSLTLLLSQAATGASIAISGQRLTAGSSVQVAIGQVVGSVATFSTFVALPGGLGALHTLDLSTACAAISSTGCSLLRIRVNGAPGSGFVLDGISGVAAAPEPATWSLMLLAFGAVAWRLKRLRRSTPGKFAAEFI